MGNHVVGSTKIVYTTKDGIPIEYIYYDLKGKNRFPRPPSNQKEIQALFYKTLQEIQASQEHLEIVKQFNAKYKYRFVIQHGRKVEEYKEKNQLSRLRSTKNFNDDSFKNIEETRKKELDEKLKLLENNQNAIKMHISNLERLISEKNSYIQFIKINGIKRLITFLDKAISTNKQGTKTIFQNQIQILKFMKSLSDHNPKQYFAAVTNIRDYAIVLMRAYHSINTAVTAYVLLMLLDYAWKVQNSLSLMQILRLFKQQSKNSSLLQPLIQTIYHTDNILMCYYNLRFINQILISIVDDEEKKQFQQELRSQRYELLIEDIKNKLQQNFFKIEHCTFITVSQAIYKDATKNRREKQNIQQNLANRGTLNLQALQQHLLVNFVQGLIANSDQPTDEQSDEDEDDSYIQVYLAENDKKSFNKFILDTFAEIQHYYKYTIIVDERVQDMTSEGVTQEMEKLKKHGLSAEEYLKRIKGNCLKNDCEQTMLNCFKALQYFQKNEWKKLEAFINEGMKTYRNLNQLQRMKKLLQQKQNEIKVFKKQYHELKSQMANRPKLQKGNQNTSLGLVNGLPNLPPPPGGLPNLPPPPSGIPNLPPPPSGIPNLPPPPVGIPILPPPPNGLPNLPPPPNGLPNLQPPPPGLPNLPPPPSGLPNLPPPPPGLPNLPPPPIGIPNLPLPPIGMPNIPTPPTIGPPSLPGLPNLPMPGLPAVNIVEQKKKPKKQPKVNLKACNYIVLNYQKIKSSIWQKVDDTKIALDQNQLQSLFARAMPKKQETKVTQSAIILPTAPKKEKIKLLGPDKYRNFQIILTKLKLPEKGIVEALTQCSGKYVVPNVLDSINKILPSEEDQMMVNSYDGSLDDLGAPEKFIKEITSVPQYASRVKALIFANNKEQIFFELQRKIQNLTKAFESLKDNYRLHHVLQVALALGNYLNGTGIKGGAWGFRLDTIQNMQEVTSADNKMNAAFYLIKQVWKKYSYPIFDKQEIDVYQYVQKMPTSQVKTDLGQLKKTLNAIEKAYDSKVKNNPDDRIDQYCKQLLAQAKSKYASLEEGVKKMDKAYTQCATFYCEDPNKAASDEIGKKIFKCVLFIFNTQKIFYQIEEKRKKEEARKAPKVQIKANQQNTKGLINLQSNVKLLPKVPSGAIKLPFPTSSPVKGVSAEEKLRQLEKNQQEKEKKFLQEMMKKRNSKIIAFRQSRMAGGNNNTGKPQQQIDFLKGL